MSAENFFTHLGRALLIALCAGLMLFGSQRTFDVVGHHPLYGYANSYDMVRLQGCHQIWPEHPDVPPLKSYVTAPVERYQHAQHTTICFPSSELIFTQLALLTSPEWLSQQRLHLRHIGQIKTLVLLAAVLFCSGLLILHGQWLALLANSLIYSFVLSDIGVTLFFNTFYTEFSAIFFMYLLLWGGYLLFVPTAFEQGRILSIVGLAGLALSKAQHMPLACALAIGLVALLLLTKHQLKRVWPIAAVTLLAAVLGVFMHPSTSSEQVKSVNRSNALYGLAATQPELVEAFLPAVCRQFAGGSWYHAVANHKEECTLTTAGHGQILLKALQQPVAVLDHYWRSIGQIKAWQYNYLGQIANAERQSITPPSYSAMHALNLLDPQHYRYLWAAGLLLALVAWRNAPWRALLLTCAAIQLGSYVIALTGDGFSELAKHAHLSVAAQLMLLISGALFLITRSGKWLISRLPRQAVSA